MDTSAEQIIDAKIKTINTKENSDDMLYPVVTKLKIITSAAIPTPLKNAFHKWLTHFYSQLSLTFIADLLVICLMKSKKEAKHQIFRVLRFFVVLKIVVCPKGIFTWQTHEDKYDNTANKWY